MTFALTGIPSSYRAPLTALELVMGLGGSSAAPAGRDILYIAKKTSSGTATVNTRYQITSESQAAELGGFGSEGHRMARAHFKANPNGRFYMVFYAASSGGSPVTASATLTVTGTATGVGEVVYAFGGLVMVVPFRTGNTADDIGELVEQTVLNQSFLPGTASNSTGTVTFSARVAGASQNGVHRLRLISVTSGKGISVAVSAATLGSGADGTTTELTNFSAALTSIESVRDYYLVTPVTVSAIAAALKTHVANKNLPNPGIRCRGFFPAVGSLSAAATIAIAQNTEVMHCAWFRNSDASPDEVVATVAATFQRYEALDPRHNFDRQSLNGLLPPAPDSADWPDHDDLGDAVNDGLIPIVSTESGAYIAMGVTTRSKDSSGTLDDFRATESHRISIMHNVAETIVLNHQLTFVNFAQQDDPKLPDGSVDVNAIALLPARVTCPFLFKSWFLQQLEQFFTAGQLQNQADWEAGTQARIDPSNTGRMQVSSAGRTIDLHHQATFRIAETTPN